MANVPNDPMILLSYINTQLRDNYPSLDELCSSLIISKEDIIEKLSSIDYSYNDELNKFI
jgi:hypothetical protein